MRFVSPCGAFIPTLIPLLIPNLIANGGQGDSRQALPKPPP